jgi:hypothetical protein
MTDRIAGANNLVPQGLRYAVVCAIIFTAIAALVGGQLSKLFKSGFSRPPYPASIWVGQIFWAVRRGLLELLWSIAPASIRIAPSINLSSKKAKVYICRGFKMLRPGISAAMPTRSQFLGPVPQV